MEINEELICRLCFEICGGNFEAIEDSLQEILNFLVLNLDLGISNEPVVCNNCIDNLKKCFHFKEDCLRKYNTYASIKEMDMELKAAISESVDVTIVDNRMCYFCMDQMDLDSLVFLKNEDVPVTMLEQYFPEVVRDITENSAVCMPCYKSLQRHTSFVRNCLDIEEKIREYCRSEGTNSKGQVELSNVVHFTSINVFNAQYNGSSACLGQGSKKIYSEEADVKLRSENFIKVDKLDPDLGYEYSEIKREDNDWDRSQDHVQEDAEFATTDTEASETKRHKCEICPYRSNRKSSLQQHILIHKDAAEVIIYSCETCSYQSKLKCNISRHVLTHKNSSTTTAYKCERCEFQAKYKYDLQKHMITHMSSGEVDVYTCEVCLFHTKYKNYLRRHMLVHKKPSEVTMYKCEVCPYQSKYKRALLRHMVIHKSDSAITTCEFKTKRKNNYPRHMVTHKSDSAITTCEFKTKRKNNYLRHSVPVQSTSEIKFLCEICAYYCKYKVSLELHMLSHKTDSEITMYECDICKFKTKFRKYLTKHKAIHKTAPVVMYKCEQCPFQTRHKRNLSDHMLVHKNSSEVTMFKCEFCTLQTMYRCSLKKHMLTHKSSLEVKMFKCEMCTYESKRKSDVSDHMLTHKSTSEVTMYRCEMCSHQSKYKSNVQRHIKSHHRV